MLIKIKAPFGEKLSGRIITKLFGSEKVFSMKLNQGCVQFINKGQETVKLRADKAIGILDLRSKFLQSQLPKDDNYGRVQTNFQNVPLSTS